MRTTSRLIGLGLATVLLAACGKQDTRPPMRPHPPRKRQPVHWPAMRQWKQRPAWHAGFRRHHPGRARGRRYRQHPELAVLAALQSAVAQVNGVRVASQMQSLRAGLHVDVDDEHVGDIRADAFTQQMIAGSQGAVLGYEILSQDEVRQLDEETIARVRASDEGWSFKGSASASASGEATAKGGASASVKESYDEKVSVDAQRGARSFDSDVTHRSMRSYWKVRVRAQIAQYRAPDEQGKPKIVVALPRTRAGAMPWAMAA